jgi:hypothetical protein
MGLLDSLQQSLLKQSDVGKRFQQQVMPQAQAASPQAFTPAPNLRPTPGLEGGGITGLPVPARVGAANPFLVENAGSLQSAPRQIGVNKPLEQPMFIGYHDNKPIYGGGKVFILA